MCMHPCCMEWQINKMENISGIYHVACGNKAVMLMFVMILIWAVAP